MKNKPAHVTEAPHPSGYSPLKVDLDFKYYGVKPERRYTDEMIKEIIKYHNDIIKQWLVTPLTKKEQLCFVFEKKKSIMYDVDKGIVKDGIHLMWPYMVTPWAFHKKVREYVISCIKKNKLFDEMNLSNTISDIVDSSIINRNNWLMYGSSKYKKEPYLLTQMYQCDDTIKKIDIDCEEYNNRFLIELLSIQNVNQNISLFKIEKEAEIKLEQDKETDIKAKKNKPTGFKDEKSKKSKCSKQKLKAVYKYIDMLDIKRVVEYKSWIELVWCLHNIHNTNDKLLNKLIEFSKKSPLHKEEAEEACREEWNRATLQGGLGMGSLKFWARIDNPEEYKKFQDENNWEKVRKAALSLPLTQFDVAEVLFSYFGDLFKCASSKNKVWYKFENHRWKYLESPIGLKKHLSTTIFKSFNKFYNKYTEEDNVDVKKAAEIWKSINKLKTTKFKKDIMDESTELFYDDEQKFLNELDEKYNLIGFDNGVYDLNKSFNPFRPGRPEDYISMSTGNKYIKFNINDPVVIEIYNFLDKIFPDIEIREYILTLLASFLNGSTKSEKFHFWTGTGGNGKSKLVELFEMAFGDYCCKLPVKLLTLSLIPIIRALSITFK